MNLPVNCPACDRPLSIATLDCGQLVSCRNGECTNTTASNGLWVRGNEEAAQTAEVLVRIVKAQIARRSNQ